MNELIEQFLIEGRDLIDQATGDLLALERRPADPAHLDSLFRAIHTLKGSAGIVDFDAMARLLHDVESVLAAARVGETTVDPSLIADCLTVLDRLAQWFDAMEPTGEPPAGADAAADALAARFADGRRGGPPPDATGEAVAGRQVGADLTDVHRQLLEAQMRLLVVPAADGRIGRVAAASAVARRIFRQSGLDDVADEIEAALADDTAAAAAARVAGLIEAAMKGPERSDPDSAGREEPAAPDATARSIRVDAQRIDALVRLAGEIAAVKTAIGHLARESRREGAEALWEPLRDQASRLDRLTGELQRSVLAVRLMAMRHVFQRFPRLVRELGASLGKAVRLTTAGDETEADKGVVEGLFEPLLHVLRNAIDHGVESPESRIAAGKVVPATIDLRASRVGDRVVVEVRDDGRGLDLARIGEVAVERGLVSCESLAKLSEGEVAELLFAPGFSTARAVTAVSGRGVGLDAVRAAVARMGGRVQIETEAGQGTTIRFVLPFTAMMTRLMTVEAGGQAYGLPLDTVEGTIRVGRDQIAALGAARVVHWRGRSVPITGLRAALGAARAATEPEEASIVMIDLDGEVVGLEVDGLGESLDILLAPLPDLLAGARGVAGATLLGDGRVLIILDPREILP